MFSPMVFTVCFALLGSLLIALTLTPVLCSIFLNEKKTYKINPFLEKLREKYNTVCLNLQVANAENDRKDIIIDELKESVASVRKIWIDANNEKELEIVRLNGIINELKRGGKSVSKSNSNNTRVSRKKQNDNK